MATYIRFVAARLALAVVGLALVLLLGGGDENGLVASVGPVVVVYHGGTALSLDTPAGRYETPAEKAAADAHFEEMAERLLGDN